MLVLGIISLVCCGFLGPVAWIMGNNAIKEIDAAAPGVYNNRGTVNAGRILGIIATVLLILSVALWVVLAITGNITWTFETN